MYYAKWEKEKNIKNNFQKINVDKEVIASGTPIESDNTKVLYTTKPDGHTLVIGTTGSGKTQATILPSLKLSLLAGESVIINDVKGELYRETAYNFKEKGYKLIVLDFDDTTLGNNWNPLVLPYEIYKENKDKAATLLEELGYYLFTDPNESADSFWTNSVIDYFTGIAMYLFENKKEVTLKSIYQLANKLEDDKEKDKFLKELNKDSNIYINVHGTLTSPKETRGGIVATFNQKMKKYIGFENLSDMLSKNDIDLKQIGNEKVAIFIVSGLTTYSNSLIPLFINQVIETVDIYNSAQKKINIILDEFDTMLPILNFSKVITYARGLGIRITVVIKSYLDLINNYGKENAEIIKACFPTIIYLLSQDIYTLEEISKMCGNTEISGKVRPLITEEELKVLKPFEAIILIPRLMPYKTKLLPDYKIDWNLEKKSIDIPKRKNN